jgi:hypothetical protein
LRCEGCVQRKIIAVEHEFNTCGASGFQGIGGVHIRALQPIPSVFLSADRDGRFASAPSAAVPAAVFKTGGE